MSRIKINGKWVVRVDTDRPSPYLKQHWQKLKPYHSLDFTNVKAVDIGCGNCRNSNFLLEKGVPTIYSLDRHLGGAEGGAETGFVYQCDVGKESFPIDVKDVGNINIFLANYVLMFLNHKERQHVIDEVHRLADDQAVMMVELYKAVDGHATTDATIAKIQQEIFDALGWSKVHWSKGKFIAARYLDFS